MSLLLYNTTSHYFLTILINHGIKNNNTKLESRSNFEKKVILVRIIYSFDVMYTYIFGVIVGMFTYILCTLYTQVGNYDLL